jgi:CheY-like chemotaxis protein
MSRRKVLFIEDRQSDRRAFNEIMRVRGFEVYSANSIAEARELADKHWGDVDVAVLDMRLELYPDAVGSNNVTGADIGIEAKAKNTCFPPEILVNSAYAEIDYYRLALKLGVAAYLSKIEKDNIIDVVRHVKVLALRHALNGENPRTAKHIARIAGQSQSPSDAIIRFCQEVLKPEMEACLEVPFVVLFSDGDRTINCADNAGLPAGSNKLYHTLQALTHGKGNATNPFVLESHKLLNGDFDEQTPSLRERLNGAAFLPLTISAGLKLSIGILQESELGTPEDALPVCKILAQYLRPTVLEDMLSIWSQWTKIRTLRYNTAKLCLFVGQELKDVLPQGADGGGVSPDSLSQLYSIAEDLSDTGELLTHIEKRQWQEKEDQAVSARETIEEVWESVGPMGGWPESGLAIEGDCAVSADRDDLEIITSRLLHWFVQRRSMRPFDVEPLISVKCEVAEGVPTITFEDTSYRLDERLRAEMFAPFTQAVPIPFMGFARKHAAGPEVKSVGRYLPLYVAKMLVEGRYFGVLEDRSDDIREYTYGNRVVMKFPPNGRGE